MAMLRALFLGLLLATLCACAPVAEPNQGQKNRFLLGGGYGYGYPSVGGFGGLYGGSLYNPYLGYGGVGGFGTGGYGFGGYGLGNYGLGGYYGGNYLG